MAATSLRRIADLLLTDEPKTRIRLRHWCLIFAIYLASAAALAVLVGYGVVSATALGCWVGLVVIAQLSMYAAIRSGWSLRTSDPTLTQAQVAFGICAALFVYVVSGEARSATLFPLAILLTFGAFAISWQRIAALAAFALVALAATMVAMHALHPGRYSLVVDLSNFLASAVVLPACSAIATIFGRFRERLRHQRDELEDALARIRDLATRDELTGLPNRRHAQALIADEAQRQRRTRRPFAIALVDLDHFKRINDHHGHAAGDAALRRFAAEARAVLREVDTIARWGGEEFLVMLPDADGDAAAVVMNRLREHIERLAHASTSTDATPCCTLSAGVAVHVCGNDGDVHETVSRADQALYRAKAAGRNRVELAAVEEAQRATIE